MQDLQDTRIESPITKFSIGAYVQNREVIHYLWIRRTGKPRAGGVGVLRWLRLGWIAQEVEKE
jgi:hypothetical protein